MCSDAEVDAIDVCGEGATECHGPVLQPNCLCDSSAWFVPSLDATSCVQGIEDFLIPLIVSSKS